jgi:hypothetical protein
VQNNRLPQDQQVLDNQEIPDLSGSRRGDFKYRRGVEVLMEYGRHELRNRFVGEWLLLLRCGRGTDQRRRDEPETCPAHESHLGRMIRASSRATPGTRLASFLTIHRSVIVLFRLFGKRTLDGGTTVAAQLPGPRDISFSPTTFS